MRVTESLMVGDYVIVQDTGLYRFTSDAVALSRFVRAKRGEVVADFCAGSGIVGLHFYAENTGVRSVTLFEMQKELADMSAETVALNGLGGVFTVENVKIQEIPPRYTEAFSLILCNPPYVRGGFPNGDPSEALCRKEISLTMDELCASAARCLKYGGRFAMVNRADRLAEAVCGMRAHGMEPKKLRFLSGKEGAKPYAALLSGVKGGKPGLDVLPTLVNGGSR